jgi:hypothetical protein
LIYRKSLPQAAWGANKRDIHVEIYQGFVFFAGMGIGGIVIAVMLNNNN